MASVTKAEMRAFIEGMLHLSGGSVALGVSVDRIIQSINFWVETEDPPKEREEIYAEIESLVTRSVEGRLERLEATSRSSVDKLKVDLCNEIADLKQKHDRAMALADEAFRKELKRVNDVGAAALTRAESEWKEKIDKAEHDAKNSIAAIEASVSRAMIEANERRGNLAQDYNYLVSRIADMKREIGTLVVPPGGPRTCGQQQTYDYSQEAKVATWIRDARK